MVEVKLGMQCTMCCKLRAPPVYPTPSLTSSISPPQYLHGGHRSTRRGHDASARRQKLASSKFWKSCRPLGGFQIRKTHAFEHLFDPLRARSGQCRGSGRRVQAEASVGETWRSRLRVASDVLHLSTFEAPLPLPPPPKDMSIFSVLPYLWTLAASDKALQWRMSLALILLVTSKACGLSGPVLFKKAVDMLSDPQVTTMSQQAVTTALFWLAASGISKALSAVLNEMRYVVFTPVGQSTGRRVALHFFGHIMRMDMAFHLDQKTGGLSRIMDRGKRSVAMIFRAVVFTFVPTVVELLLVCALLTRTVSPLFAATVLMTFLFYVAWTVALTKAAANSRKEVNRLDTMTVGKIVDTLLNFETVVQFNNQELESREYNGLLKSYQDAAVEADKISATLNAGQSMILALGMAAVMAMAGQRVARGVMTVGDLVFVNGLILQLSVPLQFLGFLYRDLRQSLVDMEQMFTILKTKPATKDGKVELLRTSEGASFHGTDLKFGYSSSRQVLKGVSLTAKPGQSVAIVGPSGSGKSTLVKLLLRLYDPSEGKIFIDGHEIRTLSLESLRKTVAVVPQDTVLFNDSLFHNIAYGRPSATRDEVLHAARQARLDRAVERMPEGYDTVVGERGLKLSGGEKQRVAIARAFLKSPRLLICDEATSALDSETEAAILKSLKELAAGRTCLFIAHRLSTIKHCDRIIVMENGLVVEEGSHESLLAKKGMYANMWALQESEPKVPLANPDKEREEMMTPYASSPSLQSIDRGGLLTEEIRSSIKRGLGGLEFESSREFMTAAVRTQDESDGDLFRPMREQQESGSSDDSGDESGFRLRTKGSQATESGDDRLGFRQRGQESDESDGGSNEGTFGESARTGGVGSDGASSSERAETTKGSSDHQDNGRGNGMYSDSNGRPGKPAVASSLTERDSDVKDSSSSRGSRS